MNFINNNDCWESTLSQEQDFQTMNQQIFEQAKYLSYGFFYDQVLSPAFEDIKKGECAVNTYLRHPYIHEFHKWMKKQCDKEGLPYFFVDCDSTVDGGIVSLPFDKFPDRGVVVFYNSTMNNTAKNALGEKKWYYLLFRSWREAALADDGRLDIVGFNRMMSSTESFYVFQPIQEERVIKRGNYAVFYVDFDDRVAHASINDSYLEKDIEVYGSFMIPNSNFRFLDWACRQQSVTLGDMLEEGKLICNL